MTDSLLAWLLDADPALRWQVERDLVGERRSVWEVTRARIATEGVGARLLALQDSDGQSAGGAFFPADLAFDGPEAAEGAGQPWTATTWTLNSLREWGLDAAVLRERHTVELLAANCRWEYENLPYWSGEVDCCINAWTVATGYGPVPTSPASSTGSSSIDYPTEGGTATGSRAQRDRHSTRR